MSDLKLYHYIIILSVMILGGSVIIESHEVSAITRDEIREMQERQIDLREKNLDVVDMIDKNRADKIEHERVLQELEDELKQLKRDSGTSWDAVRQIDDKILEILEVEADIVENQRDWIDLLDEKNSIFEELERLDFDITNGKVLIRGAEYDIGSLKKAIGISLSNNCITAIIDGFDTTCPTYETLAYLDSSVTRVSGNFVNEGGYFHRDSASMKNSWRWYDHDDTPRIFVDPPAGMASRIPMITIENNFGTYLLTSDRLFENGTRSYHEKRFIDNCQNATLDSADWVYSLPETIYLMRMGCPDLKNLDIVYVQHNSTDINIAESSDWKYKQWISDSKKKCKSICKEY